MIEFYTTKGPYGCFSNCSKHPIFVYGRTWKTSEHAYQAQKFLDLENQNKIADAIKPKDCFDLGRTLSPIREDWDSKLDVHQINGIDPVIEYLKDYVMYEVVLAKFSSELKDVLLSTGNELIVEASDIDSYWGCGKDKLGKNKLGKILCIVREIVKAKK